MTSNTKTVEIALADATVRLQGTSDSHRLDAETLLAWVLGVSRSHLYAHPEEALSDRSASDFEAALVRRETGEPVAYVTGRKEFWSIPFKVTGDTLVPRPETELLVEKALELIPVNKEYRILDLGTGSGAIAIAIASERPKSMLAAIDSSSAALEVAKENAALNNLQNIQFSVGAWTNPVAKERFDIVVSNPPYVRDDDPALDKLALEPRSALAAGPDGLDAIRTIAGEAKAVMTEAGTLLLEHGAAQQDAVAAILRDNGWTDIKCFKDLAGHPRVTAARMDTLPIQDQP